MAYEMVMPYHLHMPSYFLETFTEYPFIVNEKKKAHRVLRHTFSLYLLRKKKITCHHLPRLD